MCEPRAISESIYSGPQFIIPLAEVQFVEKTPTAIHVVLGGTTWNFEHDCPNNSVWIRNKDAGGFMSAWLYYRHERDGPFKKRSSHDCRHAGGMM